MLRFDAVVHSTIAIVMIGIMIRAVCRGQSSEFSQSQNGNLIFVHVLYRHGDRVIIKPYPTDPYSSPNDWPDGWGELTNIGKQQQYELGKWLRARYDSLLHDGYSSQLIYVRSTDIDRTLMSAQANCAGLFPPTSDQEWSPSLYWSPVPVHTVPSHLDGVLRADRVCPRYKMQYETFLESPGQMALAEHFAGLYQYLANKSGLSIDSFVNVRDLDNTLYVEQLYNKTLPKWTDSVFYHGSNMDWITNQSFVTEVGTPLLQKLKSGFLLKEILDRFWNKSQGILEPDRSFWVYSAHDVTLAHLMETLGIFQPHAPPYAACLMLELWLSNGEPAVQIFYKNTSEPQLMKLPNCDELCPLEKMYELYKDKLASDYDKECAITIVAEFHASSSSSSSPFSPTSQSNASSQSSRA